MGLRSLVGPLTKLSIAGIMVGILFMIQPWVFALFKVGFLALLVSTLTFIVVSHIPEPGAVHASADMPQDMPVDLTEAERP